MIHKDGIALKDEAGHPLMQAFWFYKDEVRIINNWHTIGMIATASEGFTIQQLRVPSNRSFSIDSNTATLSHPVYHFPFLAFAEATLAINYAGMAMHFLDLCEPAFEQKVKHPSPRLTEPPPLMQILAEANKKLNIARAAFYAATDEAWQQMLAHHTVAEQLLTAISTTSRQLATLSRQTVDALYPYAGLSAANPDNEINRVWRDIHTASQHALLTFPIE
jgi:alkylation response protein AidB-like acyl-CoA dehydrogenase